MPLAPAPRPLLSPPAMPPVPPLRPRFAPLAIAVFVLGLACVQGARAPQVPTRGTLAPGEGDPAASASEGPFAVVFGTPKGQISTSAEISIVFSRPMRPLDLAGQ